MFRSDLGSSGIHILKRAVAAVNRDVPDSDKELTLKIRLNIRLYPWPIPIIQISLEKSLHIIRTLNNNTKATPGNMLIS